MDERTARRFWAKVDKRQDGCWHWLGHLTPAGYGYFWERPRKHGAHRWSYEQFVGPIPDGLEIDHLCRNRSCVNPTHLEAVDHHTNLMRGSTLPSTNAAKTHCAKGHAYTPDNVRIRSNGARHCKTCNRENQAALRARRAGA